MYRHLLCSGLVLLCAMSAAAEESIQVTVVGTLKTGIVAIGAETTGASITAKGITWELDFGKDEALKAAAAKLSGKQVSVTGSLERRPGVEVKERWIVTVSSLKAAGVMPKAGDGKQTEIEARDYRAGTTIAITTEKQATAVDIQCERGIDRCVLRRIGDDWPDKVLLRLHLKGLESLQMTAGETTIEAEKLKKLLEARFFEVSIPAELLKQNPAEVKLQWIDFYR